AIVGCGKIAMRHAEEAVKIGSLVAVCDILHEKADAFARQFSAKAYYTLEDMLAQEKDVDIVSICTPNGLHAKHSIQSLQAGQHVLCEKPMAISSEDAKKMIKASEETGKKLYIVKQNRFNPPVAFVKQLLNEDKLGKIFSFQLNCFWNRSDDYYKNTWHGTTELDGGILYTQFSHFIDLLYWYLGDMSSAKGIRSDYLHKGKTDFEDTGIAFLQMNNGALGSLHYTINSYKKNMEGSLTLFGEKGTVKIGGQYLNELEYFSVENQEAPVLPKGNPANLYGFYEGSMSNHDKVYETMVKAIDDPSVPFITAEEALKTVEIIEKIYQASPIH
ncbi:MAG: Gfo/Idh/MocA family oxidoreductase, partial [Bacteroidia bacterium]|nr:Gfo/Idh/MocA family oxidoreductase [Bacteroidia bacterium]